MNRFVKVYLDVLSDNDLIFITTALYPQLVAVSNNQNDNVIEKMIKFNSSLVQDIIVYIYKIYLFKLIDINLSFSSIYQK